LLVLRLQSCRLFLQLLNTWKQGGENETSRQTDSGGPVAAITA